MRCEQCEYNKKCELQVVAPDITGCTGHSKISFSYIEEIERREEERLAAYVPPKVHVLSDFKAGDKVFVTRGSTVGTRLPSCIEDGFLTVLGIGKVNVKCDFDGGKPFFIPPCYLEFADKKVR